MNIFNVSDARAAAKRRLPRIFFDYVDGGAFSEATMRANTADFDRFALRQRVLVDVRERQLATTFLGRKYRLPFALAPIGFTGLFARAGEIQAGGAANAAGIPFCLSSFAIATVAELRQASGVDAWQQLYVLKDRELVERLVAEVARAGAGALVLTVDTTIAGVREKDLRNGFRGAERLSIPMALSMALRPRWFAGFLANGLPEVAMVKHRPEYGKGALMQAARLGRQLDDGLAWADVAWIRRLWQGKLVVKGILHADDARRARDQGADAVVVSNHGGRQLDGAPSTIAALPEVAAAVGREIEVLFDGGIRRGTHIVKALALGAHACLVGRAYVYGLAAAGERGVARVIELIAQEIDVTLGMMGYTSIAHLREAGRDALHAMGTTAFEGVLNETTGKRRAGMDDPEPRC